MLILDQVHAGRRCSWSSRQVDATRKLKGFPMPARDIYHRGVRAALIADGWTITHDPYIIDFEDEIAYVDLGAERLIAAEQADQKIAVEIKSFTGPSVIADVQQALGQYMLYQGWLEQTEPERTLFLAVTTDTADSVFARKGISHLLDRYGIRVVVVDVTTEEVVRWTK